LLQSDVDNASNVRQGAGTNCRKKSGNLWRLKLRNLKKNSKTIKYQRLVIEAVTWRRPGTDRAMVEKGDLVTDCHSVLVRERNHFSQLLNVHEVNEVRHTAIHTQQNR
jgi:hypothetical protein